MVYGERVKGKSCKLKEHRSRLNVRKTFFSNEGGEALEQIAKISCGWPIPESVQGQAG